jgi:hypothetical protein
MSAPRSRGAALVRRRGLGIAFLVLIALLVSLTVARYPKAFTPVVHVTLYDGQAVAPILQVPVTQVPDVAGLLLGPVLQGATLTVR